MVVQSKKVCTHSVAPMTLLGAMLACCWCCELAPKPVATHPGASREATANWLAAASPRAPATPKQETSEEKGGRELGAKSLAGRLAQFGGGHGEQCKK